jgi:hypothetical protein
MIEFRPAEMALAIERIDRALTMPRDISSRSESVNASCERLLRSGRIPQFSTGFGQQKNVLEQIAEQSHAENPLSASGPTSMILELLNNGSSVFA